MIFADTGPLVALIDRSDPYKDRCGEIVSLLGAEVMLTTWQCFTEAMHFLGRTGGYSFQADLWNLRRSGRLQIHLTGDQEADRIETLMRQYQDSPMDLADASIVAAAESRSLHRVFTVDSGFFFYRLRDGSTFDVVQ